MKVKTFLWTCEQPDCDTWIAEIYRTAERCCNETFFSLLLKGQRLQHPDSGVVISGQYMKSVFQLCRQDISILKVSLEFSQLQWKVACCSGETVSTAQS